MLNFKFLAQANLELWLADILSPPPPPAGIIGLMCLRSRKVSFSQNLLLTLQFAVKFQITN